MKGPIALIAALLLAGLSMSGMVAGETQATAVSQGQYTQGSFEEEYEDQYEGGKDIEEDDEDEVNSHEAEVEKAYAIGEYAKMKIDPPRKYVREGEIATYEVTVYDSSRLIMCEDTQDGVKAMCKREDIKYEVRLEGLPFKAEYPKKIRVPAGGKASFKLAVYTDGHEGSLIKAENDAQNILSHRPCSFNVTVKSSHATAYAKGQLYIGLPTPDYTPVKVPLSKGWNLVSLPGPSGLGSYVSVSADMEKAAPGIRMFIWLKDEGKYATFSQARRSMGDAAFQGYLIHNGFWAYAPTDSALLFRIKKFTSFEEMVVDEGWNFLPVTRDMSGRTFESIGGSCDFSAAYFWDGESQSWEMMEDQDTIGEELMFSSIIAKAAGDCELGSVPEPIPLPPGLPG